VHVCHGGIFPAGASAAACRFFRAVFSYDSLFGAWKYLPHEGGGVKTGNRKSSPEN
jgi:hypothetical protein